MPTEKRNPIALAGELLEKIGAIDLSPLNGETKSIARQILTGKGAIKAALEQIKLGKIPAMHIRMLDVTQELASSLASIQEEFQNDIFEFHDMEAKATESQTAEIVEQRKKAEQMHTVLSGAQRIFSGVLPLIVEQLIDYSPHQELHQRLNMKLGIS